jgi:hypothetical protein
MDQWAMGNMAYSNRQTGGTGVQLVACELEQHNAEQSAVNAVPAASSGGQSSTMAWNSSLYESDAVVSWLERSRRPWVIERCTGMPGSLPVSSQQVARAAAAAQRQQQQKVPSRKMTQANLYMQPSSTPALAEPSRSRTSRTTESTAACMGGQRRQQLYQIDQQQQWRGIIGFHAQWPLFDVSQHQPRLASASSQLALTTAVTQQWCQPNFPVQALERLQRASQGNL